MSHLMGEPMNKWMLHVNCGVQNTPQAGLIKQQHQWKREAVNNFPCDRKLSMFDFYSIQTKTSWTVNKKLKELQSAYQG